MTEELSRLMDSELEYAEQERQLSALLSKDSDEKALTWERYHLAANVLRAEVGDGQVFLSKGLADKIQQAVADEPTCLAPASARELEKSMRKSRKNSLAFSMTGYALAATIAAVALLGYNNQWFGVPSVDQPVTQVAETERSTRWNVSEPEQESDLNSLLVEHGEFMPPSGLNGLMAYAKFVAYDSE